MNLAPQQRPPLQRMADGGNQRPPETSAGLFNMWCTNMFIGGGEEAHRDGGTSSTGRTRSSGERMGGGGRKRKH